MFSESTSSSTRIATDRESNQHHHHHHNTFTTTTTYNDSMLHNNHRLCLSSSSSSKRHYRPVWIVCGILFIILTAVGLTLNYVHAASDTQKSYVQAMDLAQQTGEYFAKELDLAILPLYSIAQFAVEIDAFQRLPHLIGRRSLPVPSSTGSATTTTTTTKYHRNVSGICDRPHLVQQYNQIASTIITNAKMNDHILHNVQLAPYGVVCLSYTPPPLNKTDNTKDLAVLDATSSTLGLDLLQDPDSRYVAESTLQHRETVNLVGPQPLPHCQTCGNYFMAQLSIVSDDNDNYSSITTVDDGTVFPQQFWGFATVLVNWDHVVSQSHMYELFHNHSFEFQIKRIDPPANVTTTNANDDADDDDPTNAVVVLAESDMFGRGDKSEEVTTIIETTHNNEWIITVQYNPPRNYHGLITAIVLIVAFCIALLVGVVMIQKQKHNDMIAIAMTQATKVNVERNMTAYFAHELRNPLCAMDCAIETILHDNTNIAATLRELLVGMQQCSTFMSSIMNNLLDVRKMEEGKLLLYSNPLSLSQLVVDVQRQMALSMAVNHTPGAVVHIVADVSAIPPDRDWVLGDAHRIQQLLTNLLSNAMKYTTKNGSAVTISVDWKPNTDMVRFICRCCDAGIPQEDQVLQMLEESRLSQQRGGGVAPSLGLAIAKQMVTFMGGTLCLDNNSRPGTMTCTTLLPLPLCEEPHAQ